ncbi:MAG: hypothetical protein KBI24_03270 [Selenomonas sp.]|nr:hypothetical protein [Selenomonas sp.]
MTRSYTDILNLPHPTSKKHPRMTRTARAAQFAPFAALTGYNEAIKETSRLTDEQLDLDDTEKDQLNEKLQLLRQNLPRQLPITITFFIPDTQKTGGSYQTITGSVKKIQEYERRLIMTDGTIIPIEAIIGLYGEALPAML